MMGYAWEYRGTKQAGTAPSSYANAASIYLLYQATEKLKFARRSGAGDLNPKNFTEWPFGTSVKRRLIMPATVRVMGDL
jgi:hypothetical protein